MTWSIESVLNINEFIQDGRLRAIAAYSNKRIPQYPAIPTIRELGIDDRNFYRWHILVANQSADTRIIAYIQEQLLRRDIQEELVKLGLVDTSLVTTNQFFVQEYLKMKPIIDLVQ
jgi:tripartite-type tricarboxylate transporter receptor subunit TctC